MEISGSHYLRLSHQSKCENLHGHVHGTLDHQDLNAILPFNPTAENIAHWIVETVPNCYKASVQESSGNVAIYEKDE